MAPSGGKCGWRKHAAALLALALWGCAGLGGWDEAPRVNLAGIRQAQGQELETAFDIDLRVFNRSDRPITIRGMDCELALNGKRFAEGVGNPEKEIPPYGSDTVTVTVYSSMLDMVGAILQLVKGASDRERLPTYTYELKGRLRADGIGFLRTLPFHAEGKIDFEEFAPPR
jgi:LEA14-like dessication related protein